MTQLNLSKRLRRAARIIVTDPDNRILLFRFDVADRPPFWVTVGGECDDDETFEDAARRELLEETGIKADCGCQIGRTTPEFTTVEGEPIQADERYFRIQVRSDAIDTSGHTALEQKVMTQHRWFTAQEIANWHEAIFPENLLQLAFEEPCE